MYSKGYQQTQRHANHVKYIRAMWMEYVCVLSQDDLTKVETCILVNGEIF
jgi:hypothetical protein